MSDRENGDELKKENDALKKRCALMAQILDNLHEGVFVSDTNHRVTYFNRTEAKNEGFRSEFVGKKVADIYTGTGFSADDPDPLLKLC